MFGRKCKLRVSGLARGLFAAVVVATGAQLAHAQNPVDIPDNRFFDWSVPAETGGTNYIPSPFLSDQNVAAVDSFLAAQQAAGNRLAVKVNTSLTSPAAKALFDKYKIDFAFADYESANGLAQTQALVSIVKSSAKSAAANIGDFSMTPMSSDPTRPSTLPPLTPVASGGHSLFTPTQYQQAKVNVAMPALYPGAPDYRNPAQGNSNAPNIRSALFVLPIQRLSESELSLPPNQNLIPWVSRFNNWGNSTGFRRQRKQRLRIYSKRRQPGQWPASVARRF